jgi:hypothetical protein
MMVSRDILGTLAIDEVTVDTPVGLLGMVDIANGVVPRVSPDEVHFPNVDLVAHLFRRPRTGLCREGLRPGPAATPTRCAQPSRRHPPGQSWCADSPCGMLGA